MEGFSTITIQVINQDIKDAIPKDCGKCILAQAFKRYFPNYSVMVDPHGYRGKTFVDIWKPWQSCERTIYVGEEKVTAYALCFDNGGEVMPENFEFVRIQGAKPILNEGSVTY